MSDETIKIRKSSFYIIGILLLAVIAGIFFLSGSKVNADSNVFTASVDNDGVQKVNLGFKNYNYYPNTIKVKNGVPVEISLDESISGCYRSLIIRDFGVSAISRSPSEKITFTPDKTGIFRFSCSMGMGTGTLIVE